MNAMSAQAAGRGVNHFSGRVRQLVVVEIWVAL